MPASSGRRCRAAWWRTATRSATAARPHERAGPLPGADPGARGAQRAPMTRLLSPFGWCVLAIAVLSLLGLPIGLSMIGGSILYLALSGQDIGIAAEQLLQGLSNTYTLLAIPLFILAAWIMNMGSLSDRLLAWCNALVGRFRGGMGHVNVVSSVIFSGMSC